MYWQDLVEQVMDEVPSLADPKEVLRATNRVIGKVNSVVDGVRGQKNLQITAGETSSTEFVWDDTNKMLTLPTSIKQLEEVWQTDGSTANRTRFINKPVWYVEKYDTENVFYMPTRNKIQFARENSLVDSADFRMHIYGKMVFGKLTESDLTPGDGETVSDVEIDIPETWEEAFIAGVIAQLTARGAYKDANLCKINSDIFSQLLPAINNWEINRYPNKDIRRGYNYQEPSK